MLRYYLISAGIVLLTAVLATAWWQRDFLRIKLGSTNTPMSPKPEATSTVGKGSGSGVHGDAPWALSVLPECLTQDDEATGPRAYVLTHLPQGSQAVEAPATLVYGNCTIFVTGDEAYVRRGNDRFRIPPHAHFYRTAGTLSLLRSGDGGNELRVYVPSKL